MMTSCDAGCVFRSPTPIGAGGTVRVGVPVTGLASLSAPRTARPIGGHARGHKKAARCAADVSACDPGRQSRAAVVCSDGRRIGPDRGRVKRGRGESFDARGNALPDPCHTRNGPRVAKCAVPWSVWTLAGRLVAPRYLRVPARKSLQKLTLLYDKPADSKRRFSHPTLAASLLLSCAIPIVPRLACCACFAQYPFAWCFALHPCA